MERADAKGFVEEFNRAYERKTELTEVCGHRFYGDGGDEEDDLDYFQIGRRTAVPATLVEEGRYGYVSDAVVGALCEGEKGFVAHRLASYAEDDRIPTVESVPSRTVETALGHVENPDHALIPRTERYEEVIKDWKTEGRVRRFGDSRYLRVDDGRETEEDTADETNCWIHMYDTKAKDVPDEAFVLDDDRVTVVQKKGEDTRPPEFGHVAEYENLNHDLPLGVYFGDERREGGGAHDELFEIVYRIVVSEPVVEEGGVCRVRRKVNDRS